MRTAEEPTLAPAIALATGRKPVAQVAEGCCDRLFERCNALAFTEPERSVRVGIAAGRLVERIAVSKARRRTYKARAYVCLAGAYLATGDVGGAEATLICAARLGPRASLCDLAEARCRWAYVEIERQRFDAALDHVDHARRLVSGLQEERLESYLLAASGMTHLAAGRHATAARELGEAALVIPQETPIDFIELHRVVAALAEIILGEEPAGCDVGLLRSHLESLRQLASRHFPAASLASWRVRWLEAWIGAASGAAEQAEAELHACRRHFVDRRRPLDAAAVSLDLADLYLRQGRLDELSELGGDLFPVLHRARSRPETFEALKRIFFSAAAGQGAQAGLEALRSAIRPRRIRR